MSQLSNARIIAPPIEEEVYPYRRVWRSIGIQISMMLLVSIAIVLLNEIFAIELNGVLTFIITIVLVALPTLLWLIFSVIPERFASQPRNHLLSLAVITGLTASSIGIPFVQDFFQIQQWIPLQSAFERIIGYTFTVGIIDTGLKFIVLRYLVFPNSFRIRTDAIAFCVACAIGYTSVINLDLIVNIRPTLTIATVYVLGNYTMQIVSSLILSYGLSQTALDNALPLLLPVTIIVSAFLIGLLSPLESGLVNGALTLDGSFARPLFVTFFFTAMLIIVPTIVLFLYTVAERREEEKYSSDQ